MTAPGDPHATFLDVTKGMLVLGMVATHALQFLGDASTGPPRAFVESISAVTFSTFVFCFAWAFHLAYLSRPTLPVTRILRTAGRCHAAFMISGTAFVALAEGRPPDWALLRDLAMLRVLPGWSEFLATFTLLSLAGLVLAGAMRRMSASVGMTALACAACLACTYFVRPGPSDPWIAMFVGSQDPPAYPIVPFLPAWLLGLLGANRGWFGPRASLLLAPVLIAPWIALGGHRGLVERFPPSVPWIVGSVGGILVYVAAAKLLSSWARAAPAARLLAAVGQRSLLTLVTSNVLFFAAGSPKGGAFSFAACLGVAMTIVACVLAATGGLCDATGPHRRSRPGIASPIATPVGLWVLVGLVYVLGSIGKLDGWDSAGHVEYTRLIVERGGLPGPLEGWETFHPPLYYLVNALLLPVGAGHVFWGRLLAIVYGAGFLVLLGRYLERHGAPARFTALALCFVATTPSFVLSMAAYNNDPLVTLLAGCTVLLGLRLLEEWTLGRALGLAAVALLGLFTKVTLATALFTLGCVALWSRMSGSIDTRQLTRYAAWIAGILAVFLLWWGVGHNLMQTGKLLPSNVDGLPSAARLDDDPVSIVVRPPGFTDGEWADPLCLKNALRPGPGKEKTYLAYFFVSSVYTDFSFPDWMHPLCWALLWTHLAVLASALARPAPTAPLLKARVLFVSAVFGHGILVLLSPYVCTMQFRYVLWSWLPLSSLMVQALVADGRAGRRFGGVCRIAMLIGIPLHLVFLAQFMAVVKHYR